MPVRAKQRPQASPAPEPGAEPNDSWLMAAVKPEADLPHAEIEKVSREHSDYMELDVPGLPQPLYIVNDALPDGFCTKPPVALFSETVKPMAAPAATRR